MQHVGGFAAGHTVAVRACSVQGQLPRTEHAVITEHSNDSTQFSDVLVGPKVAS